MTSHELLSNDQYRYLTSQDSDITNPSEQRKRISKKVDQIFTTLQIILNSNSLEQDFKDEIFIPSKINYFISSLTTYDPENTIAEESNKLQISIDLMSKSLTYFKSRYKETKFISKEIDRFYELAEDLQDLALRQETETGGELLHKTRKSLVPPLIWPEKDFWVSQCIACFRYSNLGKDKEDSIKKIRHAKHCPFHKEMKLSGKNEKERIYEQFFKTHSPRDKP